MNTEKNREPFLIKGAYHKDNRGILSYINDFSLKPIKRFYSILHPTSKIIRAWQGHKNQSRYFYVVSGSFWIGCVKINNWLKPSKDLKPELFQLSSKTPSVLYIPPGYANGIKAIEENSILISFCEDFIDEFAEDDYRYKSSMWLDWNSLK